MNAPAEGEWSGPRPFVGREDVLTALDDALAETLKGRGQFVVLFGPDGSGRAALGRRFLARARKRNRRLRSAIGDAADPSQPAFKQLAFHFTATHRVGAALRRSAKDWAGILIPFVGNIIAAIVETVQTLRHTQDSPSAPTGTGSTIDQVRLLLTFGGNDPRIILLENLEASDPDELAGAFALIQRLPQTRTLFIGTSLARGGRLPPAIADLLREAERLKLGRAIEIPRLTPVEAIAATEAATGRPLPSEWRAWLERAAPASPTQLWELLHEASAAGRLVPHGKTWQWRGEPPTSDDALLPPLTPSELEGLSTEDIRILEHAGALGTCFEVPRLAAALAIDELRFEDQLTRLVRRRLLRLRGTLETNGNLVDTYEFTEARDAHRWGARLDRDSLAQAMARAGPADLA